MKSYSDLQQSKKLAEILPLESADMWYSIVDNEAFICLEHHNEYKQIPCWSLAALLDVLPKIHGLKPILDLEECSIQYIGFDLYVTASNLIDACVEMLLKLHEHKML